VRTGFPMVAENRHRPLVLPLGAGDGRLAGPDTNRHETIGSKKRPRMADGEPASNSRDATSHNTLGFA
jgi:hypothetical protein